MQKGFSWVFLESVLPGACVAPIACLCLHLVAPGGYVGSHELAVGVTTALLCCTHIILACQSPSTIIGIQLLTLAGVFVLGVVSFQIVSVLFGAHAVRQLRGSLLWSSLMSSLTILPPASLLKNDWNRWIRVFLLQKFDSPAELAVFLVSLGTVVGAWLGALPIPLDWNRTWQVWPITCTTGAVCGHVISTVILACYYRVRTDHYSKHV